MKHKITREGDEYACICGLRWDIDDIDPHLVVDGVSASLVSLDESGNLTRTPVDPTLGRKTLDELKGMLNMMTLDDVFTFGKHKPPPDGIVDLLHDNIALRIGSH